MGMHVGMGCVSECDKAYEIECDKAYVPMNKYG